MLCQNRMLISENIWKYLIFVSFLLMELFLISMTYWWMSFCQGPKHEYIFSFGIWADYVIKILIFIQRNSVYTRILRRNSSFDFSSDFSSGNIAPIGNICIVSIHWLLTVVGYDFSKIFRFTTSRKSIIERKRALYFYY